MRSRISGAGQNFEKIRDAHRLSIRPLTDVVRPSWEGARGLSNLLSARSLLSHAPKGASKMLRATGHARMASARRTISSVLGPAVRRAATNSKRQPSVLRGTRCARETKAN